MQKKITQAVLDHIKPHSFDYGDNPTESAIEFLYVSYSEISRSDPKDITQGFADLDRFLDGMSFEESTEVFTNVCKLCLAYEKRAFLDGLYLGVQLMQELQV